MLVIKSYNCLSFHKAVILCLIAVTFGINLFVGLIPVQNSFAQNTGATDTIGTVPGDTNGDGVVDEQDTGTGMDGTSTVPGDTNSDGVVDEQDTGTGMDGTSTVPGDTNSDGVVDEQDTGTGMDGTSTVPGDTNGDGVVDEQDTGTGMDGTSTVPGDTNSDGVVDEQDTGTTDTIGTVPGDTNGDGVVDEQDTGTGMDGTSTVPGDTNGDGVVDEQDTGATDTIGTVPGDTNGDGVVDEQDTGTGMDGTSTVPGDTNGDGVVDEQDTGATDTIGTVPGDTNSDGVVDALDAEEITTETTPSAGTTTETTKTLYQSQQFNCDPNSANLQVGSKGNKVIELQTYLTDLGYGDLLDPEKIDGKFGPHTKNSVMTYQKDFSLAVDGIVGPQTWGSLCEQISLLPTTFPSNNIPSKNGVSSTTDSSQCDPNTSCPKINVVYNDVQLVPQQTNMSCWAAGASMLVGWRDKVSINPEEIANAIGYWKQYEEGLLPEDTTMFKYWGLETENPQSYTVQGFANLLQKYGPLWVASAEPGPHIRVVTGMMGDGTPQGTLVYINDPWQQGMTTFSLPNTGSQYTETYEQFEQKQQSLAMSESNIEGAIYVAHLPYDSLKVFK